MFVPRRRLRLAELLLLGVAACEPGDPAGEAAAPTFAEHVAPILHRRCAVCHHDGGAAPFALLTYAEARKRSELIAEVVESGFMPPWLPNDEGGPFVGDRRLPADERDTLIRWEASGAGAGDLTIAPPPPRFPDGWIEAPDLVVATSRAFTVPAEGRDVFRNFVIPVTIDGPRWVEQVEIRPGNPRVVHHGILQVDRSGTARALDALDDEPGFAGMSMGSAEPPDGHFLGWTPGKAPYQVPADGAFELRPGDELVLQLHMITNGREEPVQPAIGFRFTDRAPTRRPWSVVLWSEDIDIPAGARDWSLTDRIELPVPVDLLAVYPHAHYLGRDLQAHAILPDGTVRPLLHIDDWNFDWQDEYRYAQPVFLPARSVIEMTWRYDNSADNPRNPHDPPQRVTYGERSVDEMGTLTLQVVPRDPAQREAIEEAGLRHDLARRPDDPVILDRLGVALARQRRFDVAEPLLRRAVELRPDFAVARSDLGWMLGESGNLAAAIEQLQLAVVTDPDLAIAWRNLLQYLRRAERSDDAERVARSWTEARPDSAAAHGALGDLLAISGRPADALPHHQRAVALDPRVATFHNSLGNTLLFGLRRPVDAVESYRVAIRLQPDYFNARLNLGRALLDLGDKPSARQELEHAAALRPEDPAVRDLLGRVR